MKRTLPVAATMLALALALGAAPAAAVPAKPSDESVEADPIYEVSSEDAEMNAAMERAIATLPDFYRRFAAPTADDSRFMVKFDILPGDGVEFVWVGDLDRSARPMTGTLLNQPAATAHRVGDRVTIPEAEIIDWAYFSRNVMQGAFTQRVLIDRLPPDEAAEHRAAAGW